jgi:hypothetical protein
MQLMRRAEQQYAKENVMLEYKVTAHRIDAHASDAVEQESADRAGY